MNKSLKRLKILLVEDEQSLAVLLKKAIGDNFYSFSIASNGKEGIEKFIEISPDLVITDIMMPDLTGLEMAQEIKNINPSCSIIILSAFSDKEQLLNAIDVGIIKYFIKPFDPDELLDYIISISNNLKSEIISLADNFKFNQTTRNLYKDDKYIALSRREIQFLQLLLNSSDNMIKDIDIKARLWKDEKITGERLRTFIKRLRLKTSKTLIKNIKGQGYQIITQS